MRTYMANWLMALLMWGGMVNTGAQELDLSSLVKLSKQLRAKELAESLGHGGTSTTPANIPMNAPPPPAPPPPPPPPEPPVLRMVWGVNDSLLAEVTYDGQTFILSHDVHPETGLGPWKNSHVFPEGVLLTTSPVDIKAAKVAMPELTEPLHRKPICRWLKFSGKQCLFLVPTLSVARTDATGSNKGAVFQDQVRSLMSQTPVAPVSYAPASTLTGTNPNSTRPVSNEPVTVRTGTFPK